MRRPAAGRKDRDKFISAEEQAERREGGGCHGLWRAPAVLLARPSLPAALTLLTPGSWPWSPGDAASWTPGGEPRRSVAASPSERGGLRVAAVNAVRIGRGSAEWVVTLPFPSEQGNNTAFRAECGHFGESVVADSPPSIADCTGGLLGRTRTAGVLKCCHAGASPGPFDAHGFARRRQRPVEVGQALCQGCRGHALTQRCEELEAAHGAWIDQGQSEGVRRAARAVCQSVGERPGRVSRRPGGRPRTTSGPRRRHAPGGFPQDAPCRGPLERRRRGPTSPGGLGVETVDRRCPRV